MPKAPTDVSVAAAPLVITYVLSSQVSIVTTVTGDARQYANVAIQNGSLVAWSASLTQLNNAQQLPYDITAGQMTIKQGATFTMTVPTAQQAGFVFDQMTIVTPLNPSGQQYGIQVASWPLAS
jgi:hypothetical protein